MEQQTPLLEAETPLLNAPLPKKGNTYLMLAPLFLLIFSFGISSVAIQQWLLLHVCRHVNYNSTDYFPGIFSFYNATSDLGWEECRQIVPVQSTTARLQILMSLATSIPALFMAPVFTSLSDSFGRRFLLVLTSVSMSSFLASMLIIDFLDLGLWVLVLGHAIQGFLGYLFCAISFFTLYISDSTPKNDRAPFFAFAEGILMLAFAIGPFVGGLIQSKGGSTLFWISILLNFLVIFLIMALLPESLPREKRKIVTSTVFNFSHSFINMARSLQAMPKDVFLIAVAFCLFKSSISADSQFFLYAAFKFGWDARDEGQYLLYGFSWNMVFLLVLLPLIAKIRKGRDLEKVKVLAAVEVCAIMCMAFAGNTVAIYTITVFKKMAVMSSPFVRNIQTSRVSQDNMGGMFSGIQLLEQLFSIVSAPLFSFIWSQSASWMPNMMFFANAGFVFGALLILLPLRDSTSGSE